MPKIVKNKVDILEYRKGQAGTIEIFDIVVNSQRGKGVGRSLINEVIEKEQPARIYAFCRSWNKNAHLFYERLGFKGTHITNFYEDGDAKLYVKTCK